MSETIAACENVCRDFGSWWPVTWSWLADIGTFLAGVAAAAGVYNFVSWWSQRRSEAKVKYLAEAYEALTEFEMVLHTPKLRHSLDADRLTLSISKAMNNVQLFGSAKLSADIAGLNQLSGSEGNIEARRTKVAELRRSIRDEYRSELKLEPLAGPPRWDFWNFKEEPK